MKQRLLVHGPRLADPGDLLFFDAWLWPTLQAVGVRSRLPPGDGMAIGETWPQPLLDALSAAGRTLPLPELTTELVTTSMPDVAGWLASGADPATAFSPAVAAAVGGIIAETMVAPLPSPARDAELHMWLASIDRALWSIAQRLGSLGRLAGAKLHAAQLSRVLPAGWETTVAMHLPSIPRIEHALATQRDTLFAFLADDETRRRREALYAWPASLAGGGVPLSSVPQQVADAASEFIKWIDRSDLARGRGSAVELLWKLDDTAMAVELSRPVGPTERQWSPLQRRGLAPGVLANARSDTPLALISGRPRGYPA